MRREELEQERKPVELELLQEPQPGELELVQEPQPGELEQEPQPGELELQEPPPVELELQERPIGCDAEAHGEVEANVLPLFCGVSGLKRHESKKVKTVP